MENKKTESKLKIFKLTTCLFLVGLTISLMSCKNNNQSYVKNDALDTSKDVHLVVAASMHECQGMEDVMIEFERIYPNCRIEYEYLQDYSNNLVKRLHSETDRIDMFFSTNIQAGLENLAYALDILDYTDIFRTKDTFTGLVDNFKFYDEFDTAHQYVIPLGGEMRGLYVNTTLLNKEGVEIPTNRSTLLSACSKLKDAGYIPLQENPGSFGQRLMFPQLAHMIAKDSSLKESLTLCDQSALEPLKDTIEFLYTLTENYYYNYKQSESEGRFLDLSDEGISKSFLNISLGDDNEFVKKDDVGRVPFLTAPDSLMPVLNKCKEDYHSLIDYEFILGPVSEEGGYAYMCPTSGLAINKDSFNRDWSLEFLNFIFTSKYNKLFAKGFNCTPNTKDALKVISKKYAIPESKI